MSDDADPDSTSIVQPPGDFDPEKTQIVRPTNQPTTGSRPGAQPAPTSPPGQAGSPVPPPRHQPPQQFGAAPPPRPPQTAPVAPGQYPGAPQQFGAAPPPGGPQAAPGVPGQYPGAPQQFGAAPPPGGPQAAPGAPGQYPGGGFSGIPSPPGVPGAPQSPGELAGQLVAKGTTVLARLMHRGMRGELIKSAWFQAFRNSPDQFMTVAYIIVAVLAFLMAYGGALFGAIVCLALWAALAYVFFAIGTLRAHKMVAYGIGYGGAAIALLGAVQPVTLLVSLSSYSLTSIKVGLVVEIAIAVIIASILGAFGFFVSKEIKRLSTTPF